MFQERIDDLRQSLAKIGEHLDRAVLERDIATYEEEMTQPGFWDRRERATEVARAAEHKKAILLRWDRALAELNDLELLHGMALEAADSGELSAVGSRLTSLETSLRQFRIELMFSGEHDSSDAYLSINAGAGGTDSQDWAEMILRMYGRFCERLGFSASLLEASPGDTAGLRSATLEVKGSYAFGHLRCESGVHRLVRLSPFDAAHRRHTSFCAVSVAPALREATLEIDPKDLRVDTYRSSGAGGQHVNVTDSAVRITHLPTGVVVSCQNERSQLQNRATAMRVLHARLSELLRRERAEKLDELRGELREIEWGSQIRSYVLHPYQLVKDHRTDVETSDVDGVLDGDLTLFIEAYLRDHAAEERP
ncbi:MAG: peptide chain release factor 2 [Candidatus Bipolaricaulota bacterium]